jgi:glycosyltransferase involved in cell wall biosynthesis
LANHLRAESVDAVVINGYRGLLRLGLIWTLRKRRVPVLLHGDSNFLSERDKPPWKRQAKKIVIRAIVRNVTALLVMGECGRRYYLQYASHPPPMFITPCDVDVERFAGQDRYGRRAASLRLGLDPDRRRLLFVGRLVDIKGVDLLLEAFMSFESVRPGWDLVIAGTGPLEHELSQSVPVRIRDRVHWLGFIDHDALPHLYAASNVLVLPSLQEPWGVVVTEALASGLPVVASNTSGAAVEIIGRHGGGILVPPGDAIQLSAALTKITSDQALEEATAEAVEAFRRWRESSDPVEGFRAAMDYVLQT